MNVEPIVFAWTDGDGSTQILRGESGYVLHGVSGKGVSVRTLTRDDARRIAAGRGEAPQEVEARIP